jgi:prepilin-type processing-associated H-X9-DG protein/prepilin-type N-terminal cleavage/methylation domain-containing protein
MALLRKWRKFAWLSKKTGFSLIELLVVISIISLLFALLFPSLEQVRNRAKATKCMSNLRQLGIAVHTYWIENDSKLTALNGVFPVWGDTSGTQAWSTLIYPYVENKKEIFIDPGRPGWMPKIPVSYYLNVIEPFLTNGSKVGFITLDQRSIQDESKFILMSEDLALSPQNEIDPTNETKDRTGFSNTIPCFPPYHGGKVNMLFADGHVTAHGSYDSRYMTYWGYTTNDWLNYLP